MGRFDITRTITLARAGAYAVAIGLLLFSAAPAGAQVDTDLSIGGGVRIGWASDACAAGIAGAIRYNSASSGTVDLCNGSNWITVGPGGGSIDALSDGKSDYTTDFNLWLGQNAGNAIASGGIGNLAIGQDAADALTTGDDNLAIGQESMSTLTTGTSNVAIGRYAMRSGDATASENTYVGVASGQNVTGQYNTALGFATLSGSGGITGSNNVALGRDAMRYKEGSYNVAVGADAMANGNGGSVADGNTAVGNVALQAVTEGDGNTAIGSDAGLIVSTGSNNTLIGFLAADALTTGSSNIIIGANTDAPSATGSNQLNIGNTIYGDLANDYVGIGNTAPSVALDVTGDIEYTGVISDVSDLRLKDNIVELDSALAKIMALNPVSFTMKSDPDKRIEFGFIAQDVEKIFPELVITAKDEQETKSLNYTGMIAPMVQAMQEQQRMLEAQQAQIDLLVKQNAELKAMMEEMRK